VGDTYNCTGTENSIYYHPVTQQYSSLGRWDISFKLSNGMVVFSESSVGGFGGSKYVINDFIHDLNFNAKLYDETYGFGSLSYESGFLLVTWMNRGSASIGVFVAKCSMSS
jgi:hypothetical protein